MTKLYFIRHCEAVGNVKRLYQGSSDCDISETGEKQIAFLGERFSSVPLDAVYSSPLIRAQKTAHAVADRQGLPVQIRPELIELYGGAIEGRPMAEIFAENPALAKAWDENPQDFAPDGGESMRSAYERIGRELVALCRENEGKTVAVVTHGGVLRCLVCRLLYGTIDRLREVPWCENTAVCLVEADGSGKGSLRYFNDHSHLPEAYLPKRNRLSSFMGGPQ